MNANHPERQHLLVIAVALGACQILEHDLRQYLLLAKAATEKVLAEAALGQLICLLERHSPEGDRDTELISRLRHLKGERNFLAHEAIPSVMSPGGDFLEEEAKQAEDRFNKLRDDAIEASLDVRLAWAQLHFENLDAEEARLKQFQALFPELD